MPITIVVPELGESVVEATVAEWLKKEGEQVAAGDPLVRLETDKVDLEVSAERAGVLSRIERAAGEDVQVGDFLGTLDETGAQGDGRAQQTRPVQEIAYEGTEQAAQETAAARKPQRRPQRTCGRR